MITVEIAMMVMPASGRDIDSGLRSRLTASNATKNPDKLMIADCTSATRPSDLPCPKRCSRSAGDSEKRTAQKVSSEARTSRNESARELSTETESVARQAHAFAMTRLSATATEA